MTDEYVQREENEICVIDGKRNDLVRRESSRRGRKTQGIFAINTIDKRNNDVRRQLDERRIPDSVTNLECSIERGGSLIIGLSLLFLAVVSIVLGATFLPVIGYIAGIILGVAGINFIFAPTRKGCGFFFKKDNDKSS